MKLELNNVTEYGEPTTIIDLPNGRYFEITHEEEGLESSDQFYSVRLNCNNEDFDNEVYKDTNGVIDEWTFKTIKEVEEFLELT